MKLADWLRENECQKITVYTDGSCKDSQGGYAYIIQAISADNQVVEMTCNWLAKASAYETELLAVSSVLQRLVGILPKVSKPQITLYTDKSDIPLLWCQLELQAEQHWPLQGFREAATFKGIWKTLLHAKKHLPDSLQVCIVQPNDQQYQIVDMFSRFAAWKKARKRKIISDIDKEMRVMRAYGKT